MTEPDLELTAGLSASELRTHLPPDAEVLTTGSCVVLERSEIRTGIGATTEEGGGYRNVVVEKRLVARNDVSVAPINAAQTAA
jgi:hypothetical protein